MNKAITLRFRPSWPTGVAVVLMWLVMTSSLMAEIRDVRKEITQESEQYRIRHFPNGLMPPKHDWRTLRPSLSGKETSPTPGGVGYGYYFYDSTLLWTNSTIADYYVVAPTLLGQDISYLYLTSSCRAQLGTESVIAYSGSSEAAFWIYDWARTASNPWPVMMDLPTANPQYLTLRPDEFGITRQMVHVRNGTYYLGFTNDQYQWQNRVWLFNFNRGDWDLIYSYAYGTTNLTDNRYGSGGEPTGFWGPIVETFDTYTNINPIGFDLIRLFQDGNPNPFWLNSTNSYVERESPWQLLTRETNTCFTVGVNTTNPPGGIYNAGVLCVTANTNAVPFSLSPSNGIVSSGWVVTPWSNRWDEIVVGLPPSDYSIAFNPLPGMTSPAEQMFTIVSNNITTVQAVYTALDFQNVTAAAGSIIFTWNSITGLVYQLQYETNLNQANWVNLGDAITASNGVLSATDTISSAAQRFYRVQQQ